MTHRARPLAAIAAIALLAACAGKPTVVAVAPPPPPSAPEPPTMPVGAHDGMTIPARGSDGQYATPNRDLSSSAAVWHLRSALNVAALACRGAGADGIVAGYNALLTRERGPLARAQQDYAAEYRATGATDWRARYDDAQTRLYNFFSQSFARDGFCRAAAATLDDAAWIDDAALPGFAAGRLAVLEKPFTDFFAAYDAWRAATATATATVTAAATTTATLARPTMVIASAAPVPASGAVAPHHRLELDPSVFADDAVTR